MNDQTKNSTVFVRNLNNNMTPHLIHELFMQAGPVESVTLKGDFGFVTFEHDESVPYACSLLNDVSLCGSNLMVKPRSGATHGQQQIVDVPPNRKSIQWAQSQLQYAHRNGGSHHSRHSQQGGGGGYYNGRDRSPQNGSQNRHHDIPSLIPNWSAGPNNSVSRGSRIEDNSQQQLSHLMWQQGVPVEQVDSGRGGEHHNNTPQRSDSRSHGSRDHSDRLQQNYGSSHTPQGGHSMPHGQGLLEDHVVNFPVTFSRNQPYDSPNRGSGRQHSEAGERSFDRHHSTPHSDRDHRSSGARDSRSHSRQDMSFHSPHNSGLLGDGERHSSSVRSLMDINRADHSRHSQDVSRLDSNQSDHSRYNAGMNRSHNNQQFDRSDRSRYNEGTQRSHSNQGFDQSNDARYNQGVNRSHSNHQQDVRSLMDIDAYDNFGNHRRLTQGNSNSGQNRHDDRRSNRNGRPSLM